MAKKSIVRRLSLLVVFACLLPGCQRQVQLDKELGVSDIMASVKRLYQQSPTYQDDGIQTERYALPETAYLAKNRFRLRYDRRSDEFAFAYFPLKRSYVVKKTSAGVQTIDSDDDKPEKGESLLSALHIANGVSLGTATLIPCLLKPNEVNRSSFWGYVKQLRRIDDSELDGRPHYRLQGNYFGQTGKVDFWIAHDFSIQRIVTREPEMNELERTWDFNARVDQGLPRNSFLLDQLISIEADHTTDVGKK